MSRINIAVWRRAVETLAEEHGAVVESTGGGHLRIRHPDGWRVFVSNSPSDWRGLQNVRRDIRRAMVTPPRHAVLPTRRP